MVTIIGTGNVAWHLSRAFAGSGLAVDAICGRNVQAAAEIAHELYHVELTDSLDFSESSSELFVLAVADDAIASVAWEMEVPSGATVVHTSGSKPLADLTACFDNYEYAVNCGVFYPLMTFSKFKPVDFRTVPLCIEGEDAETEKFLLKIGKRLSGTVHRVSTPQRQILHLSAVFACNFTNHLLAISQEITQANDLPFGMMKPLIEATMRKALSAEDIAAVQTGPAIRHDTQTLELHEEMLEDDPDLLSIYQLLTKSIQTFFS